MAEPVKRKSPLGYPEVVVPPDMYAEYGLTGDTAARAMPSGVTYYRQSQDVPDIRTHERIHIGQYQLQKQPTLLDVIQALKVFTDANYLSNQKNAESEIPAYEFSTPIDPQKKAAIYPQSWTRERANAIQAYTAYAQKQQQAFNNYINLIYRLNPQSSFNVEAAMPDNLMTNYIRNVPRPVPPPPTVPMEPRGLLDALFGR